MKKLKIASVSYMNTFPFIYGLKHSIYSEDYQILLEAPSQCKKCFETEEVDVALVPVAGLLGLSNYKIFSDYCIGCTGPVKTVAVFSNTAIEQVTRIYLDEDSLSSRQLTRYLFNYYWNDQPEFIIKNVRDLKINSDEAKLMIGDKAFSAYEYYDYSYDLGQLWVEATGLPFVFAVWIAKPWVNEEILTQLGRDFALGVSQIDNVVSHYKDDFPNIDLWEYYQNYISYVLDEPKKLAMTKFLNSISVMSPVL